MNKKFFLILFSASLFLAGCKTVPGEKEKIDINGMVYDTQNRPVVNYRIYIDGNGVSTSDIGGRFYVSRIQKGEHVFSGRGEGYLNVEEKIVVYDKAQILYIRVPSIESMFESAFVNIKNGEYEKAEEIINEVLETDKNNEDANYFIKTIEILRRRNETEAD